MKLVKYRDRGECAWSLIVSRERGSGTSWMPLRAARAACNNEWLRGREGEEKRVRLAGL